MSEIEWQRCFWTAHENARWDTYVISATERAPDRALAAQGLYNAVQLIDQQMAARGGPEVISPADLVNIETEVLTQKVPDSKEGWETLHAARRLFTHMRDYLAKNRIEVPPRNFSAYAAIDKLPSLLNNGKATELT